MRRSQRPILVVGVPRSGTTWVSTILALGYDAQVIYEPDSEQQDPFAFKAKLPLGRFPVLAANEQAPSAYSELWDRAFQGARPSWNLRTAVARRLLERGRKTGELARVQCWSQPPSLTLKSAAALSVPAAEWTRSEHLVIKTVHAPLAVEWVSARESPGMVVVTRHPLNVVASWVDLGYRSCQLDRNAAVFNRFQGLWDLRPPAQTAPELTRVAWEIGLMMSALQVGLARHPEWVEASHDALCMDPPTAFERLLGRLGLEWSTDVEDFVRGSNQPGDDPHGIRRVSHEQPERWRRTLSDEQVEQVTRILTEFPLVRLDT
jgi:hypothetical protein